MKKGVYLDTTIISYYFDKRKNLKTYCDITKKWWEKEKKNYNLVISNEVIAEKVYSKTKKQDIKSKATLQNRI